MGKSSSFGPVVVRPAPCRLHRIATRASPDGHAGEGPCRHRCRRALHVVATLRTTAPDRPFETNAPSSVAIGGRTITCRVACAVLMGHVVVVAERPALRRHHPQGGGERPCPLWSTAVKRGKACCRWIAPTHGPIRHGVASCPVADTVHHWTRRILRRRNWRSCGVSPLDHQSSPRTAGPQLRRSACRCHRRSMYFERELGLAAPSRGLRDGWRTAASTAALTPWHARDPHPTGIFAARPTPRGRLGRRERCAGSAQVWALRGAPPFSCYSITTSSARPRRHASTAERP